MENVEGTVLTFDPRWETFRWTGTFDRHRATYTYSTPSGYTVLKLETDAETLEIAYTGREVPALAETLEALLFGYRIFRRFLDFLEREHPEILRRIREYHGMPLIERLQAFVVGSASREELLMELRRAVAEEDYERAAFIWDQLRALERRHREAQAPSQNQ